MSDLLFHFLTASRSTAKTATSSLPYMDKGTKVLRIQDKSIGERGVYHYDSAKWKHIDECR